MAYDNWRKRLEIAQQYKTVAERRAAIEALRPKINFTQPCLDDEGYYRKPNTIKDPSGNGKNIITGWVPVAYFSDGRSLCGLIGEREMSDGDLNDEQLWSWVVSNPIPYEWYQAVAERGEPWPDAVYPPNVIEGNDLKAGDKLELAIPTATEGRDVTKTNNQPPEELPLDVQHSTAIDNAIGAAVGLKYTTVEEAAIAAGAANIIRERRLAAEKAGAAVCTPLKLAYEGARSKWAPMVTKAKAEEDKIRKEVEKFEAAERRRVAKAQLEALAKQQEIDDAAARAADRSIAAGVPEQAPVVDEVVIPQAAPRVAPTYGTYRPREKPILKFAVINDPLEVCKHFIADPELLAFIQNLATKAVRINLVVPGATFREGTE